MRLSVFSKNGRTCGDGDGDASEQQLASGTDPLEVRAQHDGPRTHNVTKRQNIEERPQAGPKCRREEGGEGEQAALNRRDHRLVDV